MLPPVLVYSVRSTFFLSVYSPFGSQRKGTSLPELPGWSYMGRRVQNYRIKQQFGFLRIFFSEARKTTDSIGSDAQQQCVHPKGS